ncbi:MAG TPA: hypothetical protein VK402_11705 [Blastococcus sp.]|nr:hypothetical protein [Blastococcus sp.]
MTNLRRVVTWLAVALVLLYVINSPEHAAQVVRNAGGGLVTAASSLVFFVGSLS